MLGKRLAQKNRECHFPRVPHYLLLPPPDVRLAILGRFTGQNDTIITQKYTMSIEKLDISEIFLRTQTADRLFSLSTYGSARFLYVSRPNCGGRVVIDFNRAFTPPCGFPDFANCPLPPPQNWLPFAVRVGEVKPSRARHPPRKPPRSRNYVDALTVPGLNAGILPARIVTFPG